MQMLFCAARDRPDAVDDVVAGYSTSEWQTAVVPTRLQHTIIASANLDLCSSTTIFNLQLLRYHIDSQTAAMSSFLTYRTPVLRSALSLASRTQTQRAAFSLSARQLSLNEDRTNDRMN